MKTLKSYILLLIIASLIIIPYILLNCNYFTPNKLWYSLSCAIELLIILILFIFKTPINYDYFTNTEVDENDLVIHKKTKPSILKKTYVISIYAFLLYISILFLIGHLVCYVFGEKKYAVYEVTNIHMCKVKKHKEKCADFDPVPDKPKSLKVDNILLRNIFDGYNLSIGQKYEVQFSVSNIGYTVNWIKPIHNY